MGKQTVSSDSHSSDGDSENAEFESEEEEQSEVDPIEENQGDNEPQEVDSLKAPNEEKLYQQDLDEVASCEVDPNEEDLPEAELNGEVSLEESNELDSCESSSEEECTGESNEESCEDEPYEEDEQFDEETVKKEPYRRVQNVKECCENPKNCEKKPHDEEPVKEEEEEEDEDEEEELGEELVEEELVEEELVEEEQEEEPVEEEIVEEEQEEEVMVEEELEEEELVEELEEEEVEEEEIVEELEELEEPVEEGLGEKLVEEELVEERAEELDVVEKREDSEELSEDETSKGNPVNLSLNTGNENSPQPNFGDTNISSTASSAPARKNEPSAVQNSSSINIDPEKLATTRSSGRKRRSRWDLDDEASKLTGEVEIKARRSRWSKNDSQLGAETPLTKSAVKIDLEIPKLQAQLLYITSKLQSGVLYDRPEGKRSPSPPPIYNNLGMRINTREARLRAKLLKQKQAIVSELIRKDPKFKPPPDYKTSKLQRKFYIPSNEYPGYNFVGLILGPRGKRKQKMEKDTGARILLRGRGSLRGKADPSDVEDLHILVKANNEYSFDLAVAMVEKLLIPVAEGTSVHKLKQRRELAKLKGTVRDKNTITYKKPDPCNICGDVGHPTSACPLTAAPSRSSSNGHQANFFAEIGVGLSLFSGPPRPGPTIPPLINPPANDSNLKKEIHDANIYIGNLPQSVNETNLMELFGPFGPVCEAKVISDKLTGLNKRYGFVKYIDHVSAAKAISQMNGYKIDGNMLAVRIAGIHPSPLSQLPTYPGPAALVQNHPGQLPTYPSPAALVQNHPGQLPTYLSPAALVQNHPGQLPTYLSPASWPGHPESRLPEAVPSFSNSSYLPVYNSPYRRQLSASFDAPCQATTAASLCSANFATSDEFANFPRFQRSLDPPSQFYHQSTPSSNLSSQFDLTQNFGGYRMPPT